MREINSQVGRLITAATADVTGDGFLMPRGTRERVYQATIAGDGSVSATVTVEGSCDGVNWVAIGSALSLSGTNADTKAIESVYPWPMVRARVASLTGDDAAVDVFIGI